MIFNDWLKTAEITDDPTGDLIGDCRDDKTLPAIRFLGDLQAHMYAKRACEEAMAESPRVWKLYCKAAKIDPRIPYPGLLANHPQNVPLAEWPLTYLREAVAPIGIPCDMEDHAEMREAIMDFGILPAAGLARIP